MNKFITLHSFTFPSELVAIKGRLEAEGIECQVKDELTVQVHNFYSNAIGGIRLQVKEKDYQNAKKILIETGYITEENRSDNFWIKINDITKNIPIFKNFRVELRLILLIGFVLSVVLFSIFGIISNIYKQPIPTDFQYITKYNWCLSHINYNGKDYSPKTHTDSNVIFVLDQNCMETVMFSRNGNIFLPGFNTKAVSGKWELTNDSLSISKLDTLSNILSNNYKIKREMNRLILESKNVTIYCHNEFY